VPIAERHVDYANKVRDELKAIGARVEVDSRNEKMNAKIREHAMQKVPFILVVGDKEQESGQVNVRVRGQDKAEGSVPSADFAARVKRLIQSRSAKLD
jgi:threonyl-tRNA synthetase